MNSPLVSVLMNVWNGEDYLAEAIASVRAQSYLNWELICWDDGSTDRSLEIIRAVADPRIRVFGSGQRQGLRLSRLSALAECRGTWVAFLDQDDIWSPSKLSRQLTLDSPTVDFIYGRAIRLLSNGECRTFLPPYEGKPLPEGRIAGEFLNGRFFIAMSSAMIRRERLLALPPIPERYSLVCDGYWFLEIMLEADARTVQDPVCWYRQHSTSLTATASEEVYRQAVQLAAEYGPRVPLSERAEVLRFQQATQTALDLRSWSRLGRGLKALFTSSIGPMYLERALARWRSTLFPPPLPPPPDFSLNGDSVPSLPEPSVSLSILVVNWRVPEYLRDCLESVYRTLNLAEGDYEVIVVDNDSGDGSAEMVAREFPRARLIVSPVNLGFGRANNLAFQHSRGRLILLLNPDTIVPEGAIAGLIDCLATHPEAGAVGCRLLNPDGTYQQFTGGYPPSVANVASYYLMADRVLPDALLPKPLFLKAEPADDAEVGWVSAACMLVRREAIPGNIFDERFFLYGEDLLFCQRLGQRGWPVLYTPRVSIIHFGGRSRDKQDVDLRLQHLQGLREVYLEQHGANPVAFDLMMMISFALRVLLFSLAASLFPRSGYRVRSKDSWLLLRESWLNLQRPAGRARVA